MSKVQCELTEDTNHGVKYIKNGNLKRLFLCRDHMLLSNLIDFYFIIIYIVPNSNKSLFFVTLN